MKRILIAACAALSVAFAQAATLSPIQLLNPAGSTSGQVIISTGPSSAPAWGGVSLSGLGAQAANTVVANATGSSASPTAFAMPSCSTSSSALTYTVGTGFTCNTAVNAAQLGGATFAAPGPIGSTTASTGKFTTLQATGLITPSAGIAGVTNGTNAAAGNIGEYPTPGTTAGTSLTSSAAANCTSFSLAAGTWDVQGTITFVPAGSTVVTYGVAGISTTSATLPAGNTGASVQIPGSNTAGVALGISTPVVRLAVASTTTAYLVGFSVFSVSTETCSGFIRATRVY